MSSTGDASTQYFRQLLSGRDIATDDTIAVGMRNYIYVIGDRATGEAIVVDPAYSPSELIGLLEADGMRLVGVLATHYHADHVGGDLSGYEIAGIAELLSLVDVPVHVQAEEVEWVTRGTSVPASSLVAHHSGDVVVVGGIDITLIHTPGHTPGSQCIMVDNSLVTGDTLFLDGCGRTDLPGGDPEALYETLQHTMSTIAGNTEVFCGHAYAKPTAAAMQDLRRTNSVLFATSKQEWLQRFAFGY